MSENIIILFGDSDKDMEEKSKAKGKYKLKCIKDVPLSSWNKSNEYVLFDALSDSVSINGKIYPLGRILVEPQFKEYFKVEEILDKDLDWYLKSVINSSMVIRLLLDNSRRRGLNWYLSDENISYKEFKKYLLRCIISEIAKDLNNGVEIDWSNENQGKYNISYSYKDNVLCFHLNTECRYDTIYCLSNLFLMRCKEVLGNELLEWYYKN